PSYVPPSRVPKLLMASTATVFTFTVYTANSGFHTSSYHVDSSDGPTWGQRLLLIGLKPSFFWFIFQEAVDRMEPMERIHSAPK
ncbi:hypothetical protein STEG23_035788, partial [Scotinomys teguina]